MAIDHPEKIGIGAWELGAPGEAMNRLSELGTAWYYIWDPRPLSSSGQVSGGEFVPMVWGAGQVVVDSEVMSELLASPAPILLGFNEPDHRGQANMEVAEALRLWPTLEATGKRLGSPAVTQSATIREGRWLPRFLKGVEEGELRVDFIAVHYYPGSPNMDDFRTFLEQVHEAYGRPIWVTEWALVHPKSWREKRPHFSPEEEACFFRAGAAMMDDLDFVERHAWFAAFEFGSGFLNSKAVAADGSLTEVGRAIAEATGVLTPP